jgi:AmmeMemoRadiSam system protein B
MKLAGGIVPHHDLASVEIARFFRTLKLQNPNIENFIVLGPNHRDIAIAPVTTSALSFETRLGRLPNNFDLTNSFVKAGSVNYDEINFAPEHSIKVLTPFIKNYYPNAKVVPIILTSKNTIDDDKRLALFLADIIKRNPNTIVIGSIDFSHYLASDTAKQMDEVTVDAIAKSDYEKIASFTSDNLDSPSTLITLLETMRLLGASKQQILEHNNSAQILGRDLNYSTSYYTIIFGND